MLSQTTEYAVRAILHIALRGDGVSVRANELAAQIGVPSNYLSKTLYQLARRVPPDVLHYHHHRGPHPHASA
jgi:DNA-binding IscR family transcriptional regulator